MAKGGGRWAKQVACDAPLGDKKAAGVASRRRVDTKENAGPRGVARRSGGQATRTAGRLQICFAYSWMVRSLENLPTRAVLRIAIFAQRLVSR